MRITLLGKGYLILKKKYIFLRHGRVSPVKYYYQNWRKTFNRNSKEDTIMTPLIRKEVYKKVKDLDA